MENFLCPACANPLTRVLTEHGVIWRCTQCDGRAVGLSLLRHAFTPASINPLWLHTLRRESTIGRACPGCRQTMREVAVDAQPSIKVEVCQLCQMIWFDAGEVGALEPMQPTKMASPELAPEARAAVAIAEMQLRDESARRAADMSDATATWRVIWMILSLFR